MFLRENQDQKLQFNTSKGFPFGFIKGKSYQPDIKE